MNQGEEVPIEDLSQTFEHSLHLTDKPQSPPFDHHQPLPPVTMSNQPAVQPRISEIHLRRPDTYDRSASKASAWIDSVTLYLMINVGIYNTDPKKIAFALSFMKERSAATWASTITKKALALNPPTLGRWDDFIKEFKTAFIHINVKNEAIAWLTNTVVTNKLPLGDYISQFKNQVAISKITHKDTLINFFSRGIPSALMKRIYGMDTIPTKIDDWYIRATQFKTQWERADMVTKRRNYTPFTQQRTSSQTQSTPKPDPYAMDVDAVKIEKLTKEEREKCFREGHCLQCRKPRHFSKDCTQFMEQPQPKKHQQNPKRVAVVKEDEQEFTNQTSGIEEATVGKITVEDF